MDALRKLRTRVFLKPAPESPKKRDRTLRHSRSMPLRNSSQTDSEMYTRSRPTYRGAQPLKTSDIQVVIDIKGRPNAPIVHPAFQNDSEDEMSPGGRAPSKPAPKPSRKDIIGKFPLPPKELPPLPLNIPYRPDPAPQLDLTGFPLDDLLPPNPAYNRMQRAKAIREQIAKEPYRQGGLQRSNSTNSPTRPALYNYPDVVQPHMLERTMGLSLEDDEEAIRKPHRHHHHQQAPASRKIMNHSNYSSKSLGGNMKLGQHAYLKEGPVAHPVVIQKVSSKTGPPISGSAAAAASLQQRPRMPSNTSVRSAMEGTSANVSASPNANTSPRRQQRRVDLTADRQRRPSSPSPQPKPLSKPTPQSDPKPTPKPTTKPTPKPTPKPLPRFFTGVDELGRGEPHGYDTYDGRYGTFDSSALPFRR